MAFWVAVGHGAIDHLDVSEPVSKAQIIVLPIHPAEPIALIDEGATLWRKLVSGPADDGDLTDSERQILHEMKEIGLASTVIDHEARVTRIDPAWLTSPLHELVCALVASVSRDAGIPVVFLKGPVLHAQGLRDREHSGDVDVWVEPSRLAELAEALADWGWTPQPDVWDGTLVNHSKTLSPPNWGCEIDLHRRMPGISKSDEVAFESVRRRTVHFVFAGVEALAPTKEVNAVLMALHSVRPEIGRAPSTVGQNAARTALRIGGPATAPVASEVGATIVLREYLEEAYPGQVIEPASGETPRDWVWRAQPNRVAAYAEALKTVPLRQRPAVLLRLIWPERSVALASDARTGSRSEHTLRARMRRLWRGFLEWRRGRRPSR